MKGQRPKKVPVAIGESPVLLADPEGVGRLAVRGKECARSPPNANHGADGAFPESMARIFLSACTTRVSSLLSSDRKSSRKTGLLRSRETLPTTSLPLGGRPDPRCYPIEIGFGRRVGCCPGERLPDLPLVADAPVGAGNHDHRNQRDRAILPLFFPEVLPYMLLPQRDLTALPDTLDVKLGAQGIDHALMPSCQSISSQGSQGPSGGGYPGTRYT